MALYSALSVILALRAFLAKPADLKARAGTMLGMGDVALGAMESKVWGLGLMVHAERGAPLVKEGAWNFNDREDTDLVRFGDYCTCPRNSGTSADDLDLHQYA